MTNMRRSIAEQRRAQHERIASVVVQETWVPGRILVQGVGEFQIEVDFGLTFTEKPTLIPGAIELENSTTQVEHLPEIDMVVASYKRRPDATGTSRHYTGAIIQMRVSGRSKQDVWATYLFFGKSFSSLGIEAAIDEDNE